MYENVFVLRLHVQYVGMAKAEEWQSPTRECEGMERPVHRERTLNEMECELCVRVRSRERLWQTPNQSVLGP